MERVRARRGDDTAQDLARFREAIEGARDVTEDVAFLPEGQAAFTAVGVSKSQNNCWQRIDHYMPEHPYTSVDRVPLDLKDCGDKERPDVIWDELADRVVILEVDEEQHRGRPCECEQARMINISQALGCERTLWIRYNPDAFNA